MLAELDRQRVQAAFLEYTSHYNAENPKIRLKIDHTFRVAALAERIADTLGADRDFAWLMGMLHDVGRFEQVKRYNTFVDSVSVDHGAFGAELLFGEGLLNRFGTFRPETEALLELVIRNHNQFRIQPGLTEEELLYCRILRDADKIDIFRVNCETPVEEIYNVSRQELVSSEVTEAVRSGFREGHAVLRTLKRTAVDNVVSHVCLVFELEFPVSVDIAREQGYVDQLMAFESENADTRDWFAYMRETLWERVQGC